MDNMNQNKAGSTTAVVNPTFIVLN